MKKGFTLIELLAVIIILAVIMVIIIPTVGMLVEDRKKDAMFLSAKAIVREMEYNDLSSSDLIVKKLSDMNLSEVSLSDYDLDNSYVYLENDELKVNLVGIGKFNGLYACGVTKTSKNNVVGTTSCPAL